MSHKDGRVVLSAELCYAFSDCATMWARWMVEHYPDIAQYSKRRDEYSLNLQEFGPYVDEWLSETAG